MALAFKHQKQASRKDQRVEARLKPEQKRRIEHAARLQGTSLSDFLVSSAELAANKAIEEHRAWTLADRDRDAFVRALLRPPAPNKRMKAALRRYRKLVKAE